MWLAPIAKILVLAAVGSGAGAEPPTSTATMPASVSTRQMLFAIPFQVERHEQPAQEPVEVRLFASADRGVTWHPYAKVAPAAEQFVFRAAADGEYWFVVRTLDRFGRLWPERIDGPELRVAVDTTLPKLELQARRGQAGEISAQWEIDELNPQSDSLSIAYRTDPNGPWQPVALDPAQRHATAGSANKGEVTWLPGDNFSAVQIRAEVADSAGNQAVSHALLDPLTTTNPLPSHTADDLSSPWHASGPDIGPANPTPDQTMPSEPYSGNRYSDNRYANDRYSADRYSADRYAQGGGSPSGYPPQGSVPAETHPAVANRYAPPSDTQADQGTVSERPGPRMLNSRLFELDYDVASVGPSGIAKVELWGTRDNGLTWRSYALDNDNRSPVLVKIDEEGIYGFRVVVSSGAGLGGQPPQSGELPDMVIGVDTTKPTARILSADQGVGTETGHLVISYEAADSMLAARPISLLYGPTSVGPWTPIVAGTENKGRYAWPIDQRTPGAIYLRLEARDEAGNIGTTETTQQLILDRSRPSGQIRSVRPMAQTGRAPTGRYPVR